MRVVASDGVRTTAAQSALFAVAANAPDVRIDSPDEGAIYGGLQPLALKASAYDREDGRLGSSALLWASSIDGALGTGARLVIDTGEFTAGFHTVTVTATDSSNMVASATVTITVKTANDPPTPADDIAYASVGATVHTDVLADDTDPEDDINVANDFGGFSDWWQTVAANPSGLVLGATLPGVAMATTADRIAAAPARWVVTEADGTAEVTLPYGDYFFCAVAAGVHDMISGCGFTNEPDWHDAFFTKDPNVHVYFSEGRAYFDVDHRRYRRIKDGGSGLDRLADVSIIGVNREGTLYAQSLSDSWLYDYMLAVVVADADIGQFWDTVHDSLHADRGERRPTYAQLIPGSARLVEAGPLGAAELQLAPGGHLICHVQVWDPEYPRTAPTPETEMEIEFCSYVDIASQRHVLNITRIEASTFIADTTGLTGKAPRACQASTTRCCSTPTPGRADASARWCSSETTNTTRYHAATTWTSATPTGARS